MTNFANQAFSLQPLPTSSSWTSFAHTLIASWVYGWLASGCAVESFLLLTGPAEHWSVSRYTLLAALNAAYLLASTSWLFYLAFAAVCWPLVVVTCVVQYATVSSFARNRLRSWLKYMHFYRDKVAFFHLPSLVIDTDLDGLVTIRGTTFSILDMTIELHGIEVGMDLGSGHELSIHSDAVTIKLFRQIAIDEVYGVHWFTGDSPNPEGRVHRADSHRNSHSDKTHSPESKKDLIQKKFFPWVEESSAASQREYVKDRILPRSEDERHHFESDVNSANVAGARRPSRGDVEAEQRYDDVLLGLRQSNRLYQSRARVRISHGTGEDQTDESPDTRAAVCADLRSTRPPMSEPSGRISVSKLIGMFEPVARLIDKVPSLLRVILWLLSQSHPVTCPSICFSACGAYLGDELLNKLFRRHAANDKRIADLKKQVTDWLSAADIYLDFAHLGGRGSVPLRTSNDIQVELRSADVIVTRINPQCETQPSKEADGNTGRVAWLKGIDTSFATPTCLLPSHAYLAPLPESSKYDKYDDDNDNDNDNNDTVPIAIAIRGHLPAGFSEPFLSFAATLSKTSQMLDIEEEAGVAADDTNSPVPRSERLDQEEKHRNGRQENSDSKTGHSHTNNSNNHLQGFRAKIAHGRIGAAIKHPVVHGKHLLHKEVKRMAVDKVDGAWFAKWTNKLLRQLEWLDGDLGYSMEVPMPLKR